MIRPFVVIIIFTFILISSSGCWDQRELNDLGIATAIGVDRSDEGLILSVQVINPSQVATGGDGGISPFDSTVTTYTAEGTGFFETLRKLTKEVPRKIYLSHIRMIVFGEDFAREGVHPAIDFLVRDHEMRIDFFMAIARDITARDVLTTYTSLEKIPANKMFNALEASALNWGITDRVFLNEFVAEMISSGDEPVLPGITIKGEQQEEREIPMNAKRMSQFSVIEYQGLGVFHGDRLVGWMTEDESIGYNFIKGNIQGTIVRIDDVCPKEGESVSIELIRSNTTLKSKIKDGKPSFNIKVEGDANIGDANCEIDLQEVEQIYEIESGANLVIENYIKQTILKNQSEFNTDIFGFGDEIKRNHPEYWKTIENAWDEEFQNVQFDINVEIRIKGLGTLKNSFKYEMEKISQDGGE